jgi:hypothetical protein
MLRQKDHEFKASLGNLARLFQKKKKIYIYIYIYIRLYPKNKGRYHTVDQRRPYRSYFGWKRTSHSEAQKSPRLASSVLCDEGQVTSPFKMSISLQKGEEGLAKL